MLCGTLRPMPVADQRPWSSALDVLFPEYVPKRHAVPFHVDSPKDFGPYPRARRSDRIAVPVGAVAAAAGNMRSDCDGAEFRSGV